jgi:hypothetical protein
MLRVRQPRHLLENRSSALFRSVRPGHNNIPFAVVVQNAHEPGVAAHLTVLHQIAANVSLEIQLDFFAAVRAPDQE